MAPEAVRAGEDAPPPVDDLRASTDEGTSSAKGPVAGVTADRDAYGGYEPVAPSSAALVEDGARQSARSRSLLAYAMAMPVGSTYRFVGQYSFAGFSFDWRSRVVDKVWAGFSLGWQVLYDKGQRTSQVGDVTLTGTQVRHLNNFPLLLTAHYYPIVDAGKVQPYLGMGVGTVASERRVDVGLMTYSSVTWHFELSPELGVVLPLGENRFALASRFNYALQSGGSQELLYFTFSVGIELQ